jgi:hypothetical protein
VRLVILASVLAAVLAGVSGAGAAGSAHRTQIVFWSPFSPSSAIRSSLKVVDSGRAGCPGGPGSNVIGGLAFRCNSDNFLFDPCWPAAAAPTNLMVCANSPWSRTLARLHVARGAVVVGVTHARPVDTSTDAPWGILLAGGTRCSLVSGARDRVPGLGVRGDIDYTCRGGLLLLRDLHRGRTWTIPAVRRVGGHYRRLGRKAVAQAVFGGLPKLLRQRNSLAHAAAIRGYVIERSLHRRVWVARAWLSYPKATCARVELIDSASPIIRRLVLVRRNHRWAIPTPDEKQGCQQALPASPKTFP